MIRRPSIQRLSGPWPFYWKCDCGASGTFVDRQAAQAGLSHHMRKSHTPRKRK